MTCEKCRLQLLPYLYDLLEPAERQEIDAHLQTCASCREALKVAREQQGLLAEAVKEPSDIVFRAPPRVAAAASAPTVAMEQRPARRSFFWLNRWAAAAAALLFIFGTSSVIAFAVYRDGANQVNDANTRLVQAREAMKKAEDALNQKKSETQQEIREIQKEIDTLFGTWKKEEQKERALLEKKAEGLQITVNGPPVLVAGTNTPYEVELKNSIVATSNPPDKNLKLPGVMQQLPNVQARVVNQNKDVLYQQNLKVENNNRANMVLPPDMPIHPGDQIALEFLTETDGGKSTQLIGKNQLQVVALATHLVTDRPMYRPGETVRFRSLTLERFSLKPAQEKLHLRYRIVGPNKAEIFNKEYAGELISAAKGEAVKGPGDTALHGLGVGEFVLPAGLAEGEYTLSVSEINERFQEEKRSFLVRRWQTPRLNKEVKFHRSSYGPGEQVKVHVQATPVQGGGFRNALSVSARVNIDGNPNVYSQNRQTDGDGRTEFEFTLPAAIAKGVGVLTIECNDAGNVETVVRNIPIVLRDLHVEFYPEGGDLIVGVPNRVYFQARTPAGKPADIQGVILNQQKKEVARIQTLHDDKEPGVNQGLGSFTFTPMRRERYTLRIDTPIGIERPMPLPTPKDSGVALHVPQGVLDNEIKVSLQSTVQPRELLVGAYCRGRLLDQKQVKAGVNQPVAVTLKPNADAGGVYRVTVFEKIGKNEQTIYRPLAERLIYRKNAKKIDVAIQSPRTTYQPGETVQLDLQATNEKREPVPAIAVLAVVDTSVLKLRDEKTARSMPTHFLLTTEVRNPEDLEYADFLLGDHPQAQTALDLLLGSQGWRRFAEQDPARFQKAQKDRAPVFLANANTMAQFLDAEQKQIDKLDTHYVEKAITLQRKLAESEKKLDQPPPDMPIMAPVDHEVQLAQARLNEANQRQRAIRGFVVQFGLGGALLTLLFLGFYLVSVGLRRLSEGGEPRVWLASGAGLLGLLFIVSIIGTFALMGEPIGDEFRAVGKAPAMGVFNGNALAMGPQQDPEPPRPIVEEELVAEFDDVQMMEPGGKIAPQAGPAPPFAGPQGMGNNLAQINNFNNGFIEQGQIAQAGQLGQFDQVDDERILRRLGNYQAIVQKHIGRRVQLPPVQDACVVREYAHQHRGDPNGLRRDFAETLYWQPVLVMPDGKAQVQFDLSDSITRFQVLVLSHTQDGRLGSSVTEIISKLPFSVDPKTPIEVTQSDQLAIPIAITNELPKKTSLQVQARAKNLRLTDNADLGVQLGANQNKRITLHAQPTVTDGTASLRVIGKTAGRGDGVERKFTIVADGFPVTGSASGVLENNPVTHEINLPADIVPGSARVHAYFFPSPAAELQGGLDAMLREPVGCFEQSSSSNYPNTLVLNYLKQTREANPTIETRARNLLQAGYSRLTAFECNDPAGGKRGYEWFGGNAPPHEALTAYGLLQFRDMARITNVEEAMLKRTEKYLLDQRDGAGTFKRNTAAIDTFGRAPDAVTNAYIVWALTESGAKADLDAELAALRKACKSSKDPYLLSLVALSHLNRKKVQQGVDLLLDVRLGQKEDGHFAGAKTSITGSQGHDLDVETASLAILAYLKADRNEFDASLGSAIRWLGKQRRGTGGFGGTQATILALKAMLAYHDRHPKVITGGELQMFVTGGPGGALPPQANFGQFRGAGGAAPGQAFEDFAAGVNTATLSPRMSDPITLTIPDARELRPGKNTIELNVNGNNVLPYSLTWSYRVLKPPSDPQAPVKLVTSLATAKAKEGNSVKLSATVENVSGKGQGMTVAIIGLPSGLAIPENSQQLSELIKQKAISAWELRGRELVLYWRGLAPAAKQSVELDLVCRLPGVYRGPASRAYLYYDADRKFWVEPLSIRIAEANGEFVK
ncbi:MAG TPA: alpha-2-macroglobulin family protein [Gemmataceae bacterium]|nr:alpha-2-macroglobulin family protein [Gemmataceae bacterium]